MSAMAVKTRSLASGSEPRRLTRSRIRLQGFWPMGSVGLKGWRARKLTEPSEETVGPAG